MDEELVVRFREEPEGSQGALPRKELREIAEYFHRSEEFAVHVAISRLWTELFGDDGDFDFPSDEQLHKLNEKNRDDQAVVIDSIWQRLGMKTPAGE